jgi:DNA-binding CsgD family transcriptional regulator
MARGLLMADMLNRETEQAQPPHPLRSTPLSALVTEQPLECSFEAEPSQTDGFAPVIAAYAAERGCSPIQRAVLGLHFAGLHNKAIADALQVALATVYEHWRRMALKAGCRSQSDVVADVYRYLVARFTVVERIARPG